MIVGYLKCKKNLQKNKKQNRRIGKGTKISEAKPKGA